MAVTTALIEDGGGGSFIYLCFARLFFFKSVVLNADVLPWLIFKLCQMHGLPGCKLLL